MAKASVKKKAGKNGKSSKKQAVKAAKPPAILAKKAALLKKYPGKLSENDFHLYDGETEESVNARIAERAGVPFEEL